MPSQTSQAVHGFSTRLLWPALIGTAAALMQIPAQAGRPLAVDDAATAPVGECQVEAWFERQRDERAWLLSPACGVAAGLELGLELNVQRPRQRGSESLTPALKWAPEAARTRTGLGELAFGLKLADSHVKHVRSAWTRDESRLMGLATLAPSDQLALHLNLGLAHNRAARASSAAAGLALAWAPQPQWLLFAEVSGARQRSLFGPAVQTIGARWWLLPDQLGLDLTSSRERHGAPGLSWTLGFGLYGLRL